LGGSNGDAHQIGYKTTQKQGSEAYVLTNKGGTTYKSIGQVGMETSVEILSRLGAFCFCLGALCAMAAGGDIARQSYIGE